MWGHPIECSGVSRGSESGSGDGRRSFRGQLSSERNYLFRGREMTENNLGLDLRFRFEWRRPMGMGGVSQVGVEL